LREVAYLGCASLLKRVEFVPFTLDFPEALLADLVLVVLLESGGLLHLDLALAEDLLSCLFDLLFDAAAVGHLDLIVPWTREGLIVSDVLFCEN
jgi:hypothetical protein